MKRGAQSGEIPLDEDPSQMAISTCWSTVRVDPSGLQFLEEVSVTYMKLIIRVKVNDLTTN